MTIEIDRAETYHPAGISRGARLLRTTLAAALLATLIAHWELVRIVFRTSPWSPLGMVSILFLGLVVGSVVGLLKERVWGFYSVYALVPVSTVLHGIALVPLVITVVPEGELRVWGVLVLNFMFLMATVVAHVSHRRAAKRQTKRMEVAA